MVLFARREQSQDLAACAKAEQSQTDYQKSEMIELRDCQQAGKRTFEQEGSRG